MFDDIQFSLANFEHEIREDQTTRALNVNRKGSYDTTETYIKEVIEWRQTTTITYYLRDDSKCRENTSND